MVCAWYETEPTVAGVRPAPHQLAERRRRAAFPRVAGPSGSAPVVTRRVSALASLSGPPTGAIGPRESANAGLGVGRARPVPRPVSLPPPPAFWCLWSRVRGLSRGSPREDVFPAPMTRPSPICSPGGRAGLGLPLSPPAVLPFPRRRCVLRHRPSPA